MHLLASLRSRTPYQQSWGGNSKSFSSENPLLGGAEGVSLRGGSSGWRQPTPAPLQRRGIILMLNGTAPGGMGASYENSRNPSSEREGGADRPIASTAP